MDGDADGLPANAEVAVPNKYGRVSPAFLARHAMRPATIVSECEASVLDNSSLSIGQAHERASYLSSSGITDGRNISSSPSSPIKTSTADSFLESLGKLRKKRHASEEDDLDLLSEFNTEDSLTERPPVGAGTEEEQGPQGVRVQIATRVRRRCVPPPTDVCSTGGVCSGNSQSELYSASRSCLGDFGARNLINGVDESAIQLVNKLRMAPSGQNAKESRVKMSEVVQPQQTARKGHNIT